MSANRAQGPIAKLLDTYEIEAPVLYSEHMTGDGQKIFEHAAKLNSEGIVSKLADAPYKSERGEAWLKVKTVQREKFPVVGFVKDPTGVAALYLGKQEDGGLRYVGKVGTGWSRTVSSQIRKQLDTVVSPKSKLTKPVRKPKATWTEPLFFADVEYRDITSEGLLRASSFKGLSEVGLMIKNGIYALTALATDGAGVDAGGVLILHDGKIHGGDSYVYYVGTYKCSGGKWEGEILSKEHTPTNRPMAERVQQIAFTGSYSEVGAEVEATAVVGKQLIKYEAMLRFLAAG